MIQSLSGCCRHPSSVPGHAEPWHGRCSSQKTLKRLRDVACTVRRRLTVVQSPAVTACCVRSGTYTNLVGSPALRFLYMPGTDCQLPSSREFAKYHTRSFTIGPPM